MEPTGAKIFYTNFVVVFIQLGPVKAPQGTYTPSVSKKGKTIIENEDEGVGGGEGTATLDDESIEEDRAYSGDDSEAQEESKHKPKGSITKPMVTAQPEPKRRAKRRRTEDDLEEQYMRTLQEEEDVGNKKLKAARNAKQESNATPVEDDGAEKDQDSEGDSSGGSSSEPEDKPERKKDKKNKKDTTETTESPPIRHETLMSQKREDLDEAARTVFLGNVPSIAISSKVRLLAPLSCFTSNTGNSHRIRH